MRRGITSCLLVLLCAGRGVASEPGRIILIPDTRVLEPGSVRVDLVVDNRDRDPLGIDVLEATMGAAVGLARRVQLDVRFVPSRVVAMPDPPPLPPSPLDLIVIGDAVVPRVLHTYFAPHPYTDKRGRGRFDDWVPGDATLAVTFVARESARRGPRLALVGEAIFPLARAYADLRSGSSAGSVNAAGRAVGSWTAGRLDLLASARGVWLGEGALGDRVVRVAPPGPVVVQDEPLRLGGRAEAGVAARLRLSGRWAVVAEAETARPIGGRTPSLDEERWADLRAGIRARLGAVHVLAALRWHAASARSGERRASPLGGMLDVTDVNDATLGDWLRRVGAAGASSSLRPGAHRVVAGAPAGSFPAGARPLDPDYVVRSEHQLGFTLAVELAF